MIAASQSRTLVSANRTVVRLVTAQPAGGAELVNPGLNLVLQCLEPGELIHPARQLLKVRSRFPLNWDRRYQWDWTPGLSWWLGDSSGNWHVAMADEPRVPDDGMQAYPLDDGMQVFWLRLTPPLATIPDAAKIVVTGPATRIRATVPVHPAAS